MDQSLPVSNTHDMYRILNECGEDASCGCGCSGEKPTDEPKAAPKSKGKKKQKLESVGLEVSSRIEEARKKLGLKTIRRLKKVHVIRANKAPKVVKVSKMPNAIRKGAANNRHR